ncbi:MAG: hypothetical protein PWP31_1879 [Clostridia bacterium]|nr:hypothetical protein [Clostridia bacterium]
MDEEIGYMVRNGKVLAIIPARGGSKRLPEKNLLNLAGKPLISWTIEAAKESKYIDKIVVSSDDEKILDVAERYNVYVIKRPEELATDSAKTIDVVKHAISILEKNFQYVLLLQPTSPLRKSRQIDEAFELLIKKDADAVISVSPVDHPVQWCNALPEDLSMKNFLNSEVMDKRSQDLPVYYRLNGAIYIAKTEKLIQQNSFFLKDNVFAYIMDRESSIDIDDWIDFRLAEVLIERGRVNER